MIIQHRIAVRLGFRSWQHLEDSVPHLELVLMLDMLRVEDEARASARD